MSDHIKTIDHVVSLLNGLKSCSSGVSELTRLTGLPKTTVFRILKALEIHGLVMQVEKDQYALGYGLAKYRPPHLDNHQLISISRQAMKNFATHTKETINLSVSQQDSLVIIHSELGERYLLQSSLENVTELHSSSMGKLFLAQRPSEKVKAYFEKGWAKRTVNTVTSYEEFLKENISSDSIVYDREEYEYGLTCLATGLWQEGRLVGCIGCSGPTTRLKAKGFAFLEEALMQASQQINQKLNQ